jgi:hypothetical protein
VINWHDTINPEKKLDLISWLKKGEQIVDICHNVWFTHSSVHTICDNFGRIKESAQSGSQELKCLCTKTTTVLSEWTVLKTMDVSPLHFYCISNKLINCIEMYIHCIHSRSMLYRFIYPLAVELYPTKNEVFNPLTLWKYNVLNGNVMFNLCDFFRNITLV